MLDLLVGIEIALALILLLSAGLMLRSLARLRSVPLGFEPHQTIVLGLNLPATAELARSTSIPVIASGGLAGIADVEALLRPEYARLEGAIAGRALYDGRLDAAEALALLSRPEP